jgi:hypothetical protein
MFGGTGGVEKNAGGLFHFEGKTWTQVMKDSFQTVGPAFAQGNSVYLGIGDGSFIHTTDMFKG